MKIFFKDVYCAKPKSSRNSSQEAFIIGKGFKYSEVNPLCNGSILNPALDSPEEEKKVIIKEKISESTEIKVDYESIKKFVRCGDISIPCDQPAAALKEEIAPAAPGLALSSSLSDYMNLFN
jgi:hypothetical protein